ncbi:basic secretory protein-like protein [Luteimonas sp. TWI1416]|uniref:basic secretory protein-like protein n=1 Tax=unclassified Luteimonas TaxID=2629088 RepID=UPI00320A98E8
MTRPARLLPLLCLLPLATAAAMETTIERDGVTLVYRDATDALDAGMRDRIVDTFFSTYARQRADFNPAAADAVDIVIDPDYDGVAFVDNKGQATMTINPAWLIERPGDVDLVTHEAMHIVQSYPGYGDGAPVWLTEGIADYARDRYGLDNAASGWALPDTVADEHRYDTGYRVSGAFLKWADTAHPGLVHKLDAALRAGAYTADTWAALTGETIDATWARYAQARAGERDAKSLPRARRL